MLIARFVQIQIAEGARCEKLVADQCWGQLGLSAKRGCILDRNGDLLAFDIASETFYTYVADKRYLRKLAGNVSRLTGDSGLVDRVMERAGKFNLLARMTSPELAAKIRTLECDSIYSYQEYQRVCRYGTLAQDLLGQVDVDNNGVSGIEFEYDEHLKPTPGLARFQRDGRGRIYRISDTPIVRPSDGCELRLTLDVEYQQIVEEELKRAVAKWDAHSGMVVLIESATGRVLAADYFAPCGQDGAKGKVFKSRFVSDLFEPGSTFKIVAFAGMLEDNLYSMTDTVWGGMGRFAFNGRILHDDKEHGTITFRRAFEQSSNIATGRFAQGLKGKRLYKYARQFGFGQRTGIDLPGEAAGRLRKPRNWSDFWTAQVAIGHGISVSALQMAAAIGAIANDGVMMKPYVVEEVRSATGRLQQRSRPQKIRSVISGRSAAQLRGLMAGVVDSGTAAAARTDEVLFAGKTGTAQKPDLESGGYFWDRYVASFGGFFPRENPSIAGIVIIDEPKRIHYGGYTAAPVFAEIARRITLLEKTRENWMAQRCTTALAGDPAETDRRPNFDSAKAMRHPDNVSQLYDNIHRWIADAEAGEDAVRSPRIDRCRSELSQGVLPDVKGLPACDAVVLLSGLRCRIEINGTGKIQRQSPEPGSSIESINRVVLWCSTKTGG